MPLSITLKQGQSSALQQPVAGKAHTTHRHKVTPRFAAAPQHCPQAGPELCAAVVRCRQGEYLATLKSTAACMCTNMKREPACGSICPVTERGVGLAMVNTAGVEGIADHLSRHAETPADARSAWSAAETPAPLQAEQPGGTQGVIISRTAPCLLPEMSQVSTSHEILRDLDHCALSCLSNPCSR